MTVASDFLNSSDDACCMCLYLCLTQDAHTSTFASQAAPLESVVVFSCLAGLRFEGSDPSWFRASLSNFRLLLLQACQILYKSAWLPYSPTSVNGALILPKCSFVCVCAHVFFVDTEDTYVCDMYVLKVMVFEWK